MFGSWTSLIALVVTLLPLLWAKRWTTRCLQELSLRWVGDPDVALIVYFVVVLPGVILHEFSHWLMATVLGVRVRGISIGPVRKGRSKRVSLGSVRIGNVDPVRASLIGLAPLLGGAAVILLIGNLVLGVGDLARATAGQSPQAILVALGQAMHVADFWLWIYLIFSVSNAMLPSESDMASVRPVFIFLGAVILALVVVRGVPSVPPTAVEWVNAIANYLASAFGLTLVVDAIFMLVIGLALWATRQLQQS
jgi:hypothetical protein